MRECPGACQPFAVIEGCFHSALEKAGIQKLNKFFASRIFCGIKQPLVLMIPLMEVLVCRRRINCEANVHPEAQFQLANVLLNEGEILTNSQVA